MTDAYTDELFMRSGIRAVVFPVSRLVVDPERFMNDADEPMAAKGMGVIYTRASDGQMLRPPPSKEQREDLLARYYLPHHKDLEASIKAELEKGSRLIVDCHSFPSLPLPCDLDQSCPRPDICLGSDTYHTPDDLLQTALDLLKSRGISHAVNLPYSGSLIPMRFFRKEPHVWSIMIEVRREGQDARTISSFFSQNSLWAKDSSNQKLNNPRNDLKEEVFSR